MFDPKEKVVKLPESGKKEAISLLEIDRKRNPKPSESAMLHHALFSFHQQKTSRSWIRHSNLPFNFDPFSRASRLDFAP